MTLPNSELENLTIRDLMAKRRTIKGRVARFRTLLDNLDHDNLDITQLQLRLQKMKPCWDEFERLQSEIDMQNDFQTSDSDWNEFENSYFKCVTEAEEIIANATKNNVASRPQLLESQIKLPTIHLPTFNGAYDQWLYFYDTFNSLIHTNQTLSNIQKFHYLRSSLKNDGLEVIESLQVTEYNYEVAWGLLKDRFQNKPLIIHNHIKSLYELKQISRESHFALRQLLDNVLKHMRALKTLNQPTEHWDTLIIFWVSLKLDATTKKEWDSASFGEELPNFDEFTKFLSKRCQLLETANINKSQQKLPSNPVNKPFYKRTDHVMSAYPTTYPRISCHYCKKSHYLFRCEAFLKMPVFARLNEVNRLKICANCFRSDHNVRDCIGRNCKKCNGQHNTLLHVDETHHQNTASVSTNEVAQTSQTPTITANCSYNTQTYTLLPTAIVHIFDRVGQSHECRVLLDTGSQANFVTNELCNRLNLPCDKVNLPVAGINQSNTNVKQRTIIKLKSRYNVFSKAVSCLVLPKLTQDLPTVTLDSSQFSIPENICLADPTFNQKSKIDMLLGSEVFWDLLCIGQIKLGKGKPILQKTHLGWIVSGSLATLKQNRNCALSCNLVVNNNRNDLQTQLQKFWELEECAQGPHLSQEESKCENHFTSTTSRDSTGRFIVSLPFKDNITQLGESEHIALKRFYSLEKRLAADTELKSEYIDFITEYERLGHMTRINPTIKTGQSYYFPHHAVIKDSSLTTKVRVVFDGSSKTSTGISLNDTLMVGPTIQDDLFSTVIRFRFHRYVFTADITKMYRQILIQENQRDFQRILWRSEPNKPIQTYQLNTVTYGTSSAAFQAIRCLHQLGIENKEKYPVASRVISKDFYVDDVLTGSATIKDAIRLRLELTTILESAGFELRKFVANDPRILDNYKNHDHSTRFTINEQREVKTLGLQWDSEADTFQYTVKSGKQFHVTKRKILSVISQIFDPLGLIGPFTVRAKIMLQKLWQLNIGWDESVPQDIHTAWIVFQNQLHALNNIAIPRHVICVKPFTVQMHGFSDSSESAYGACVYMRSVDNAGNKLSKLLCAKSRVAPLKSISLPRLELCGALLLSKLMHKISETLTINIDKKFYWCDSTIALAWIATPPNQLKTFVANRVSEIQNISDKTDWRHVHSQDNPADIISRGLNIEHLANNNLWWDGPEWLKNEPASWPTNKNIHLPEIPDLKGVSACVFVTLIDDNFANSIFTRYSQFIKLQRVIAYCLRFKKNSSISREHRMTGSLRVQELQEATNCLIKLAQYQTFAKDIHSIKTSGTVKKRSKILPLHPFLDENQLLRVGGRLKHAQISYSQKHPILLPASHILTKMLIQREHIQQLHAGPQQLLANIRLKYWPISGCNIAKQVVRECVRCFKAQPRSIEPLMGNLPQSRVIPARPFSTCGVDYAGPFLIKDGITRGRKLVKSYICVFVCFSTKAIHLELVGDLTTESFIAALKRFISRRGLCTHIYSDNGSNFLGAKNELKELTKLIQNPIHNDKISNFLSSQTINWHLIPPRAPHFGGLWEAVVKSTKRHMRIILGNAHLNYEEFYTMLAQIEACLNSRPLVPLSSDPNDLSPLTPGHFLIGDSLMAIPEHSLLTNAINRLTRFQRVQQLLQHFWKRWSKEYLSQLQHRVRWHHEQQILQPGTLVVLKEDNLPPLRWSMGRIIDLHPGSDGVVRVITVKTAHGTVKRAVTRVCALPIKDEQT